MTIELVRATEEQAHIVENLIPFYIYDLSSQMGWRTPDNGRFGGQDDLPQYWGKTLPEEDAIYAWPEGSEGHPFLVHVDDELAGFALAKRVGADCPSRYEVGAFFIVRKFRRRRIGTEVAHRLFGMFPGEWTVGSLVGNTPANRFWESAVCSFTGGEFRTTRGTEEPWGFELIFQHFTSEGSPEGLLYGTA